MDSSAVGQLRRRLRLATERPTLRVGVKMTMASGLSWWLGGVVVHVAAPAAAMVPLIVFRNEDPWNVWRGIVGRMLGVFIGVGIAVFILAVSRPSAWWVVVVVAATAAMQAIPKVGESLFHNWQIAVSFVLVVGLGPGPYGTERLVESVVGGAVTIAVANLVWPPDPAAELRRRLARLVDQMCDDLRHVPGMVGADQSTTRLFAHRVLGHASSAQATLAEVPVARRSLRFSIRRWSRADQAVDDVARRIQLLSSLYYIVEALAHHLGHLTAEDADFVRRNGLATAYQTAVNALVGAVEAVPDRVGAADDGVAAEVGAALAETARGPWMTALTTCLTELGARLSQAG